MTFSRDNWLALSTPFADQTRAQVTWDPEVVKTWRIVGYENRVTSDASFAEDRKEFAELPSGRRRRCSTSWSCTTGGGVARRRI